MTNLQLSTYMSGHIAAVETTERNYQSIFVAESNRNVELCLGCRALKLFMHKQKQGKRRQQTSPPVP